MAKAQLFTRTIRKVVKIEQPGCVELNLTPEEASTLLAILNRIGGCPTNSPRKESKAINGALVALGVRPDPTPVWPENKGIYFQDRTT